MDGRTRVVIYGNRRPGDRADDVRRLIVTLVFDCEQVNVHAKLYDYLTVTLGLSLPDAVQRVERCPENATLAISIGGDGTFLRTVGWTIRHSVPVLGINTGHLGYLTAMTLDEALEDIERIVKMDFREQEVSMLDVTTDAVNEPLPPALNEVVLAKEDSASMITADARLDGSALAHYQADGLIVSTPTGSTAYNLSVGGPIVQPTARVMVISPIAAHSLTLRPLVVDDGSIIEVEVSGRGRHVRLAIDGRTYSLPMGAKVRIAKSARVAKILLPHNRDFAGIIGTKLLFSSGRPQ